MIQITKSAAKILEEHYSSLKQKNIEEGKPPEKKIDFISNIIIKYLDKQKRKSKSE